MSIKLVIELSVPPSADSQEEFACGVSVPGNEYLLKSIREMEKNGLAITLTTDADPGYAIAFFHPLTDSGKEDHHLYCLVDKTTLRDLARKAAFVSQELELEENEMAGSVSGPKSITYTISLPPTQMPGGIGGATVTYYGRSYVPPKGKLLTLEGGEFEVLMSTYDPLTDSAYIQLGVESYYRSGDTNLPMLEETYQNFCEDMISLAQNHDWKLLGDATLVPHVRHLFIQV